MATIDGETEPYINEEGYSVELGYEEFGAEFDLQMEGSKKGDFLILIVGLNFYVQFNCHNSSKLNFEITRWLNLLVFSSYFTIIWLVVGNYLIFNFRQFEILWVLLLWAAYLVLLLPLAILYAGDLRKWFLMLLAVYFLDQQYGPDVSLRISRNLRFLHSVTGQGVIAALALLIIACFLGKAWGPERGICQNHYHRF